MKKTIYFIFLVLAVFLFSSISRVYGDELTDINNQLDELTTAYNQSKAASAPLESQLNSIKKRVAFIETDLARKKRDIDKGYENLEKQKELLDEKIVNYYINSYRNCQFCFLLSSSIEDIINNLAYQQALIQRDKDDLIKFALTIVDLERKKANLEEENIKLADIKGKLDKIVTEAKAYQAVLSSKIAQLTAQQQSLIAQRLDALGIPRSAGTTTPACISDIGKDPGFISGFAFFTYGVPNRTGLNQYGAWGRAKAGQDHKTILNAYYTNFELKEDYDENIQIHVVDSGIDMTLSIEDYVKRIYEMPGSWVENDRAALKAQAIAARSYALSYTNNGQNSICATEKCQVFKTDPKGGDWEEAANATRGDVMVQGGSPVKAWYSSTHGGYVFSSGELPGWSGTSWTKHATDTTTGSVSGFGDLGSNAYDKESPWFYCDWGSRKDYNKTAWLKSEEIADIANVILLVRKNPSAACFVYQTDTAPPAPNPSQGCSQTDNWSTDKVKQELGSEALSTAASVEVTGVDWGSGKTTQVKVNGISFDGNEFKNWFNVRAPANIQIVGPLFNVEKR